MPTKEARNIAAVAEVNNMATIDEKMGRTSLELRVQVLLCRTVQGVLLYLKRGLSPPFPWETGVNLLRSVHIVDG
jgi:hypothetical protein